jgi:dipeptidyl aminopeptidase/acylaminoacyl peptidase
LSLLAISREGKVLAARDTWRREMIGLLPGEAKPVDLEWFDYSFPADLSADGKTLLFDEEGQAGGANYAVYLRGTDGSPAVRLGEGGAAALSPDGQWVLSYSSGSPAQLSLLPTGAGQSRQVTHDNINHIWARFLPDGKRFVFDGTEPGKTLRLYVQDLAGGAPRAISPEGEERLGPAGVFSIAVSPDGKFVAALAANGKGYLYPIDGGAPRVIAGFQPADRPVEFSSDGRSLYVSVTGKLAAEVDRIDLASGQRTMVKTYTPSDLAGVASIGPVLVTPDAKTFIMGYPRFLSDLYLVENVH